MNGKNAARNYIREEFFAPSGSEEIEMLMKFYLLFNLNPLRLFGDSGVFIGLLLLLAGTIGMAIWGFFKKDYSYVKKSLKILLIPAAVIILIFIFLAVKPPVQNNKNTASESAPPQATMPPEAVAPAEIKETGLDTQCTTEAQCWCRNFNGAGFVPGKVSSKCDTTKSRCVQCFYD